MWRGVSACAKVWKRITSGTKANTARLVKNMSRRLSVKRILRGTATEGAAHTDHA